MTITNFPSHSNPVLVDLTGLPDQVVRQVQQLVQQAREQEASPTGTDVRLPLIGRFAHLGLSFPKEQLDQDQRDAWNGFPREFPDQSKQ